MLEADVEVDRRDFTVAVALEVHAGERLALFGPSGSGKTTTLEAIAGLIPLRRGRITLAGRVLSQTSAPHRAEPPWRRRVGLLRQDPGLFPHLSVRQNLCYGMGGPARRRDRARARPGPAELSRIAAELGIDALLDDRPARLSGGQAHRVALGRLLLADCAALLLDEPYTGLDAGLRRGLTDLVRTLVAVREVPAVLVAHELSEAQAFADRLAVIDAGRLLQTGSPAQVVARPASCRVAELVGYRGFVPAAADRDGGEQAGRTAAGEGGIVAAVHPERVVPGTHPDRGLVVTGWVQTLRPAGAGWDVQISLSRIRPDAAGSAGTFWCHLPDRPAKTGEAVTLTVLDPPRYGGDGALLPDSDQVRA